MPTILWLFIMLAPATVYPQALGEYGRAVGGIPQGQGVTGPRALDSAPRGGSGSGVSDVSRKAFPVRLVVAAKEASLHPKQDDETEQIAQLTQGETLIPMVQSSGGNDWYMVRTEQGMIGWVKSADVREEKVKK